MVFGVFVTALFCGRFCGCVYFGLGDLHCFGLDWWFCSGFWVWQLVCGCCGCVWWCCCGCLVPLMSVGCAGFCFGFTGCLSVVNIVGFAWVVGLIVVLWAV